MATMAGTFSLCSGLLNPGSGTSTRERNGLSLDVIQITTVFDTVVTDRQNGAVGMPLIDHLHSVAQRNLAESLIHHLGQLTKPTIGR